MDQEQFDKDFSLLCTLVPALAVEVKKLCGKPLDRKGKDLITDIIISSSNKLAANPELADVWKADAAALEQLQQHLTRDWPW